MNRFMLCYTQKDLIIFFCGKITKKRGRTGSRLEIPVQRGELVRSALVQMQIKKKNLLYEAARHVPGTPRFLFSSEPS